MIVIFHQSEVVSILIPVTFLHLIVIKQHLFIAVLIHLRFFLLHDLVLITVVIVCTSYVTSFWHFEVIGILLLLIEFAHDFLSLEVCMEVYQLLSHVKDHVDLGD